jgi:hypothetical protein
VADPGPVLNVVPRFLESDSVEEVLAEAARLMPGENPVRTLLREPYLLLLLERGTSRLGDHPDM